MQRLELVVRQGRCDDGVDAAGVVGGHPLREVADGGLQVQPWWGWNVAGGLDVRLRRVGVVAPADDHLDRSDPSRVLALRAGAPHQPALKLLQQRKVDRPALSHMLVGLVGHVDVVENHPHRLVVRLVLGRGEDAVERFVCALQCGGRLGLHAEALMPEQPRIGQLARGRIQRRQCGAGVGDTEVGRAAQLRRVRREGVRLEGQVSPRSSEPVVAADGDERAGGGVLEQ